MTASVQGACDQAHGCALDIEGTARSNGHSSERGKAGKQRSESAIEVGQGGMRTADRARNAARGALSVACRFSALNYRLTLYFVTPNLGPLFSELANQDEDLLTLGWGSFGARIHRTWCTYNGRYFSLAGSSRCRSCRRRRFRSAIASV